MSLETFNFLLALGTVALQIATVVLLALFFFRNHIPDLAGTVSFVEKWGIPIAFLATFGASVITVVHSGIFGLPPCPLCYWQRIFLYPQAVLFALAYFRREKWMAEYSILLSVIGLGLAIYHHALQMFPTGMLPCPSEGEVSCAQIFFLEFGYITYPMMAGTLFAFLIVLMLFLRKRTV